MHLRYLIIHLLLWLPQQVSAQHCGEMNTYAFSIAIETGKEYRSFDDDQLYLVDAFGRPVMHEAWDDPKPPYPRHWPEPIRFIENSKKERKAHAHPDISRYDALDVLGDYIAVFRFETREKGLRAGLEAAGRFRDSVYQLKIIATRKSGEVDTLLIPLDSEDLISFCSNGLGSKRTPLESDIGTLGGERKSVVSINLSALPKRPVNLTPESFLYQFHFSKPFQSNEMGPQQNQFRLDAISIHDPDTFRELQEIFPKNPPIFSPNEFEQYVDTGHFELPGDRPPDLLISHSSYLYELKIRERGSELYRFNPMQSRYEYINEISRMLNLEWDTNASQWISNHRAEIGERPFIFRYSFVDGHWQNAGIEEVITPIETDAKVGCLVWDDPDRFHLLPVQLLEGRDGGYVHVIDSFEFFNNCQQKFRWKLHDKHENQVVKLRLEGPINGKERGSVVYVDSIWHNRGYLNFINEYITIPLKEAGYLNVRLQYFVTDPSLRVKSTDGLIHYEFAMSGAFEHLHLATSKEGFPIAYGEIDPATDDRVGLWKRWTENGKALNDTLYKKKLRVRLTHYEALQVDFNPKRTKVEVMIDSLWKPLDARQIDGVFLLYPDASYQAYRFTVGDAAATVEITYEYLKEETTIDLLPFNQGTAYYTCDGVQYPVVFTDEYVVHIDPDFANARHTDWRYDQLLTLLQSRFPEAGFYAFQMEDTTPAFSMAQVADSASFMAALLAMPEVKGVSRVVDTPGGPTYFDDRVILTGTAYVQNLVTQNQERLAAYDFDPNRQGEMPGNMYSIYYLGQTYDGEMLRKLNQLQKAIGVRSSNLNWYFYIDFDHR